MEKKIERIIKFKANEDDLVAEIARRAESLKNVRTPFEAQWRKIRKYLEPDLGKALVDEKNRDESVSRREDHAILNGEVRQMHKRYAAGMQSGITNYAQAWFQFVPQRNAEAVATNREAKDFYARATESCADAFKASNFYLVTEQVYLHSSQFGTAATLLLHGAEPGEIHLQIIDEGDYWIAEDRFQRVNVLMRRIEMTIAQAAEEFMVSNLPEQWQKLYHDGKREERVTIWNLICPNEPENRLFADVNERMEMASFYWTEGGDGAKKTIIDIRAFDYNPIVVYRHRHCGSVYGKGIGDEVLGDLKELQQLEEYSLRMVAGEAMPALQAPASLKGKVNNFPGGTTYYDEVGGTGSGKVTRLFETHNDINYVEEKIKVLTERIGRAFYNDLFSMMLNITSQSGKQMTAREVNEISAEKVTLLGPVLTRMDHDFLGPATDACFAIRLADGFIDDIPEELEAGEEGIGTEYTSSIHTEMKANLKKRGLFNILDVTAMVAQLQPDVVTKIDGDSAIDDIAMLHPGSATYVRSTEEARKIREAQAAAQAEANNRAMMAQLASKAGANAKALAEAKLGNGSALDKIIGEGA